MRIFRSIGLMVIAANMAACGTEADAFDGVPTGLQGTVSDQGGAPVSGAFITARLPGSTVSHTTVSTADGQFALPVDVSGTYEVAATTIQDESPGSVTEVDFEAAGATAESPEGSIEPSALTLTVGDPGSAWDHAPARAFMGRLPDGEEKRKFILDCTGCHQFDQITVSSDEGSAIKTAEEWTQWATQMIEPNANMSPSRTVEATASWLHDHVPATPGSTERPELSWEPLPVSGAASRAVITEYDIPVPQDLPHDVKVDIDGRIVITGQLTGVMYLLDPATGEITYEPMPMEFANPRAIDIDGDGNWYVAMGAPQSVARKDRATGEWDIRHVDMHPHSVQLDGQGRIWYNGHFSRSPERIGSLHFDEDEPEEIVVPADPMPDGGITMQYGLRVAPDGTVWTTQLMGGRLIRYDPPTGDFRLYDLPISASGPRRPDVAADGRVWIPEFSNNRLAVFDPETETFTEYEMPVSDMLPYVVRVDRVRDLVWIGTASADAVVRFDPATETFDVFPVPTKGVVIRHLDIDQESGEVWGSYGAFPSRGTNRVFRVRTY